MNAAPSKAKPKKPAAPKTVASPPSKSDAKGSAVQVVEAGSCPSLSGRSTLGYELGKDTDGKFYLRIRTNSGGGKFNPRWLSLTSVMEAIASAKPPITSSALRTVVRGQSANQQCFVTAALLARGLLERLPGKERAYGTGPRFEAGLTQLNLPTATKASGAAGKPLKAKTAGKSKAR